MAFDTSEVELLRRANARLDALVKAQERTNELLVWIGNVIQAGAQTSDTVPPTL